MGSLIAILLLLLWPSEASAANGASLRGQWRIEAPSLPNYTGVVLIDSERRVVWDSPADNGKPAKFQGYVTSGDGPKVEIALTDRVTVARVHCTTQSNDLLHCYLVFTHKDAISVPFALRRVGLGPQKLTPILP